VWGRQDGLVDASYADAFAERLADGRVALLEGAGHLPQLEQAEHVIPLVLEFLA
jgi:2-hydroxymuconate-semialdehyde hydrolase